MTAHEELRRQFGDIDVYVFDQILRGRIAPDMRILDAGCGKGRNLIWLASQGAEVHALDRDAARLEHVRALGLPTERLHVAELETLPFPDASFDVVLCNAVLHFARDEDHFACMVDELARVTRRGGLLFARTAAATGIEAELAPLDVPRRFRQPDGDERFLVDEALLLATTARLGGELLDPLKTTRVRGLRAMTTWVVRL
jgi:SAM-dependent methyltransferase